LDPSAEQLPTTFSSWTEALPQPKENSPSWKPFVSGSRMGWKKLRRGLGRKRLLDSADGGEENCEGWKRSERERLSACDVEMSMKSLDAMDGEQEKGRKKEAR